MRIPPFKKLTMQPILRLLQTSFAIIVLTLTTSLVSAQTLTSDRADYPPMSLATFYGNGFGPNEQVVLKVKNLEQPCNTITADSSYLPWTVYADANGSFITTWTVCNCPGDSLRLKATGSLGSIAYLYFSDNVSFTPATGGLNISADNANNALSPLFTTLGNIVVSEPNNGKSDFTAGTYNLVLSLSANWIFNNTGTAVVTGDNSQNVTVGTISYAANSITIPLTVVNSGGVKQDVLTISGLQVKALEGANIPNSATITSTVSTFNAILGLPDGSVLANISQKEGNHSKIVVTLPGQSFTDGNTVLSSGNTGTVTSQTTGISFNLVRLTATDQFFNIITSYSGAKTISYSGPSNTGGTPSYTTAVSFTAGQSTTTLTTTLTTAEITSITASDGTVSGPASSNLTVIAACTSPTINTQPASASITYGANTSFTVVASGTSPNYQWQVNTGSGFVNIDGSNNPGGIYSGFASSTLTITKPPVSARHN